MASMQLLLPALALAAAVGEARAESDDVGLQIANYLFMLVLVMLSALFSGLTLGLLGLDTNQLRVRSDAATVFAFSALCIRFAQIVMEAGSVDEKRWAAKIWPVRQNGNLLLCTLLLGNVLVNAQLSILTADLTTGSFCRAGPHFCVESHCSLLAGTVGLVASTGLIVIFGEIIPQALCSRYALKIGAATVPLVRVIIIIMYIVAKPISMVLDYALGEELGKLYSEVEFNSLIEQHAAIISEPRRQIMQGALKITHKSVADIMTPRDAIFSLNSDEKLTFEVMSKIFKSGYSRIPVFSDNGTRVVGVLYAKDLMLVVPADEVPVVTLISFFERDQVATVDATTKIEDCLKSLTSEGLHFAMVRDIEATEPDKDPVYRYVGCVTMEDVVEEILQMELDESDVNSNGQRTDRAAFGKENLRLLDTSRGHNDLEPALVRAVAATLQATVPAFQTCGPDETPMPFSTIEDLVRGSRVLDLVAPPDGAQTGAEKDASTAAGAAHAVSNDKQLYTRGNVYTVCTLVLNGEFDVVSGSDGISSVARSFELLAPNALTSPPGGYKADFTARLRSGTARVLRIARDEFADAVLFARPAADYPTAAAGDAGGEAAASAAPADAVATTAAAAGSMDVSSSLLPGERARSSSAARASAELHIPSGESSVADPSRLQSRPGLGGISGLTSRDANARRRKGSNARATALSASGSGEINDGDVAIDVHDATGLSPDSN